MRKPLLAWIKWPMGHWKTLLSWAVRRAWCACLIQHNACQLVVAAVVVLCRWWPNGKYHSNNQGLRQKRVSLSLQAGSNNHNYNSDNNLILLAILCRHAVYITLYNYQSSAIIRLLSTMHLNAPSSLTTKVPASAMCLSMNEQFVAVGFDNGRVQVWQWKPSGVPRDNNLVSPDSDWTLVATFPSSSLISLPHAVQGLLIRDESIAQTKKHVFHTSA